MICFSSFASAQNFQISGVISDSLTDELLIGVNVKIDEDAFVGGPKETWPVWIGGNKSKKRDSASRVFFYESFNECSFYNIFVRLQL